MSTHGPGDLRTRFFTHHFTLALDDDQVTSFALTVFSAALPRFLADRGVVATVLKLPPAIWTHLV